MNVTINNLVEMSGSLGLNEGRCITCGYEACGVEPDARHYECKCCGNHTVYGCEELLIMGDGI